MPNDSNHRTGVSTGNIPKTLLVLDDATSLREDLALMRAISDTSSDVIFAKDRYGRMRFANPAALALIGKPLDEVLGRTDVEFLEDKEAALRVIENDRRIMDSGVAEELEEIVPLPDGSRRIWLSQKCPYRNERGETVGLLGISRDITERKSQEESVSIAHAALQRVLDSITDGLAVLDSNWNYTYFSDTGAKMLGLNCEDLIGKSVWELFPHADDLLFGKQYRQAVATGIATHFEEFYPAPLNVWLECHCYPSSDGLSVYFRDVTSRRLAQEAADEVERRINAVLEATPVGLAYADANGELVLMNTECRRIWGDPPASKTVDEYVQWKGWWADGSERHGLQVHAHEWPMARALAGEHVVDALIEVEPFNAPGTIRTLLLRSVPNLDREGCIRGAVTAQMDITDAVKAKAAVEESSRQLRQLANTIPQLAWMADETGFIHWYNERWYEYTGTNAREMEGWGWQSVHHPDTLPLVEKNWKHSLETGTPFEMTFPMKDKSGHFRQFYTLVEPMRDANGKVVQWFGTNTDVSALDSIQAELRKTQHWLQEGLEAGKMVAWEWDLDADVVRYSENITAVMGYSDSNSSKGFKNVNIEDRTSFNAAIETAIANRSSFDVLTRRTRPDNGELIWVQTKGHVLTDDYGKPNYLRGILVDVTEQIERQAKLEEQAKRKDEFLAMLAHELRNPMAPIATAAQLLRMPDVDAKRVKMCATVIARQVSHMTSLIDDLLDVSRVTRGLIDLERESVDIKEIVQGSIEQARTLIDARGHGLVCRMEAGPTYVTGDRVRLTQVLVNLLNNAAKYTAHGGEIILDVAVDQQHVQVTVSDNGIGIDAALLPHVFELFTQAARTSDRAQGGLGLGLALVENLVKMHGGKVAAHSAGIDQGSQFVVTLPRTNDICQISSHDGNVASVSQSRRLKILIVDDNEDAADTLGAILECEGHAVTIANTPSLAISLAQAEPFDAIVLDIGLPDMDGYVLARHLRAMPQTESILLVALTGYGQANDKIQAKDAGFDCHLVKPVNIADLNAALEGNRENQKIGL
ncbi:MULTISPECIES: PAS domain-containing protein [unclassified Duganella]|uniref:PAS domain-containing hybrid sensor histidine kinase/response regulator n=1 Tax=unclassified Duganella TaxID=2636909 RepID=UPI0008936AB4|nr:MULTISPECIES: PAS domain-containing protein [unclassified Duganella]OEZ63870.1 autoinducer 2 sensor kinase/phosphatase LuxQ [Duganella sp. HH105]OFA06977.1 autoinducer 2 sensor kinase/phosphatase LuxQ [Duganella sp. HH101]